MLASIRPMIASILIAALLSAGCGGRRYIVRSDDYILAQQHGGVVGAVTFNCRETAVLAQRTQNVELDLNTLLGGGYDDYLAVQESSSRSVSIGVGIGGILLGTLLSSMGGMLIYDANRTPQRTEGDTLPQSTGKVLGGVLIIAGAGFALSGITAMTQGAFRGAEAPRRWSPAMTSDNPCVQKQHDDAYKRASRREHRANGRMPDEINVLTEDDDTQDGAQVPIQPIPTQDHQPRDTEPLPIDVGPSE